MAYLLTQPQALATAAVDVAGIGSAIGEAKAAAAAQTSGVVAAAADEVSAATATLFSTYAQECQAVIAQAEAFHREFARVLAAAGDAYAEAEAAAARVLGGLTAQAQALLVPLIGNAATGAAGASAVAKAALADPDIALIMGPSGVPTPSTQQVENYYNYYVKPNFPSTTVQELSTPEGLYPITGIKDLTLNVSAARGVTILRDAILQQVNTGNTVTVFGYSQSAILASLVMPQLLAAQVPAGDVSFVLVGNEMNPNGGMLARFPGLSIPSLGITFYGGTPTNAYPTVNYTLEYDGFADFPQYPINVLADLNAFMGIAFVHTTYGSIDPAALPPGYSLVELPTQGPTMTTYYLIDIPNLPLLEPVRWIPYIGNPLADLLQPNLTYLVNWGYGDPAYGYSTGPADVVTPFGFLPPLSATTALGPLLVSGTQQGISDAVATLYAQGPPLLPQLLGISNALTAIPTVPPTLTLPTAVSAASAIENFLLGLQVANTNAVGGLANALSTGYATLLPTADIASALLFTMPSYNVTLFLNGVTQMVNGQPLVGLVNAIGNPIAADVGLVTLAAGIEFLVLASAVDTILTGNPHPSP